MKRFFEKHKWSLLFIIPGLIAGYLYWRYIGCNTGTCPITSVWYNSSIYGGILGYIAGNLIDNQRAKTRQQANESVNNE